MFYAPPSDETRGGLNDPPSVAVKYHLPEKFNARSPSPGDKRDSPLTTGDKQEEEEDEEDEEAGC